MLTIGIDSYVDFNFLNSYVSHNLDASDKWNALSDNEKLFYSEASMIILEKQDWIGVETDNNQELKFPRSFSRYTQDGTRIANYQNNFYHSENPFIKNNDLIFPELQKSQCEIVIDLLVSKKDENNLQLSQLKKLGVESFKVSSISFTFTDSGNNDLPLPEEAYKLLKHYLRYVSQVIRLERG